MGGSLGLRVFSGIIGPADGCFAVQHMLYKDPEPFPGLGLNA